MDILKKNFTIPSKIQLRKIEKKLITLCSDMALKASKYGTTK